MIDGTPCRETSLSSPLGKINFASEPVVFASTLLPSSLRTDDNIRTTLDFPRVPVTLILSGIEFIQRFIKIRSYIK